MAEVGQSVLELVVTVGQAWIALVVTIVGGAVWLLGQFVNIPEKVLTTRAGAWIAMAALVVANLRTYHRVRMGRDSPPRAAGSSSSVRPIQVIVHPGGNVTISGPAAPPALPPGAASALPPPVPPAQPGALPGDEDGAQGGGADEQGQLPSGGGA